MFPFIEIFGEKLPTYLIIISGTYCLGILYLLKRTKHDEDRRVFYLDSFLILMIAGFIGARLLHIVYEEPKYYLEDIMRVFYVWRGGFVFFGGAIAAFFGIKYFCKKKDENFERLLDYYAPVIIACYILGRFSCLLAGCCFGESCDLPWGISYPHGVEAPHSTNLHPTPIYAILWALFHWQLLLKLESTKKFIHKAGDLFYIAMIIHGMGRLFMEYFRADHRGSDILHLSISSWISIALILFGIKLYQKKEFSNSKKAEL